MERYGDGMHPQPFTIKCVIFHTIYEREYATDAGGRYRREHLPDIPPKRTQVPEIKIRFPRQSVPISGRIVEKKGKKKI